MKEVANIPGQVKGVKESTSSEDQFTVGQIVFFIYLIVQIVICCRERCNYQKARGEYDISN